MFVLPNMHWDVITTGIPSPVARETLSITSSLQCPRPVPSSTIPSYPLSVYMSINSASIPGYIFTSATLSAKLLFNDNSTSPLLV